MDSSKLIANYLNKMTKIQNTLLGIINKEESKEMDFQDVIIFLNDLKICKNRNEFKSLLHLLSILYETHHQKPENMVFIEKIIFNYKDYILENFQNCEIYSLFNNDNKLLLYLIESQILKLDENIINQLRFYDPTFFYQEVKDSLKPDIKEEISKEIPDDYIIKRKKGENDSILCEIIRNDSIDEFISYVAKSNISLNHEIEQSIFETNPFLINKDITLIEYAAFFGSMKIFKYLQLNKVEITESLWIYAIHSQNTEIISILEDLNIKPDNIKRCYKEAIKCHFNDMANYIQENYLQEKNDENDDDDNNESISPVIYFKYYNFEFIKPEQINKSIFIKLCRYDYLLFVDVLLKTEDIDINALELDESDYNENDFIRNNNSALFEAISFNNTEIADLLLEKDDIDVNYRYCSSIVISLEDDKVKFSFFIALICQIPLFFLILHHDDFSHDNFMKIDNKWLISIWILGVVYLISLLEFIISNSLHIPFSIRFLLNIQMISPGYLEFQKETMTALHYACFNNNAKIVKALLKKKNIDVNAIYYNVQNEIEESNALGIAINNEEIVKSLLCHPNIDINISCKSSIPNNCEINFSIFEGLLIFKILECKGFYYALCVDILIFAIIAIIWFLNAPPATKKKVLISLLLCILVCSVIIYFIPFEYILEKIRNNKDTLDEIRNFYSVMLKLLNWLLSIFYIISIAIPFTTIFYCDYIEETPLINAIENDHNEIAKLLLSNKNINVNSTYKHRYFEEAESNYFTSKLLSFLNYPFSYVDSKDIYITKTALNIAVEKNSTEIFKLLLLNPNTNIEDTFKSSFIKRSLSNEPCLICLFYLIESVQYFFVSKSEKTSLNIAVENTNIDVVKLLLEKSTINNVEKDFIKMQKENAKEVSPTEENDNDSKESLEKKDEILRLIQNFINENHTS